MGFPGTCHSVSEASHIEPFFDLGQSWLQQVLVDFFVGRIFWKDVVESELLISGASRIILVDQVRIDEAKVAFIWTTDYLVWMTRVFGVMKFLSGKQWPHSDADFEWTWLHVVFDRLH